MATQTQLTNVDGFTIIDIEGVARLVGPVRLARKVLPRTTIDLVRHATYACAIHKLDAVGAAAALNHDRPNADPSAIETFAGELTTWAEANNFVANATLGLDADEVNMGSEGLEESMDEAMAASASSCLGPSADKLVIVSAKDEPALTSALGDRSPTTEPDLAVALSSGADAVFVRAKTATLDHAVLEDTNVGAIIGLQPLTTTARGLAFAGRAGTVIVPDFISAAGATLAALGHEPGEIASMTSDVMAPLHDAGIDMFVTASETAESHLSTLSPTLPFGRAL